MDGPGFKTELPRTGRNVGIVSGGGWGRQEAREPRVFQTDGASCKAWKCESI